MTLYSVANPYPVILNQVGSGLNGGKIYIGVAGQDPETNPVPVYWDAGGTDQASQPLTTIGGYIWNAGTPAQVYGPSEYSIRVRDRFNQQIFYEASVNGPLADFISDLASSSGSSQVGFSQSGAGAGTRTIETKLRRELVSVEDFASSGDFGEWLNRAIAAVEDGGQILIPGDTSVFTWTTPAADGGKSVRIYGGTNIRAFAQFTGAATALTLTGWGSRLERFNITGNRTTGQILISATGYDTFIGSCFLANGDTLIKQPDGSNSHAMLFNLRLANAKSVGVDLQDGVGCRLLDVKYDTDIGTYAEPTVGGFRCSTEGVQIALCDFIRAGNGLVLEGRSSRDLKFFKAVNCFLGDSCDREAVKIINSSGRQMFGFDFTDCWAATSDKGVLIQGADIYGVNWRGGEVHNNQNEGLRIEAGSDIVFDTHVYGNSASGAGNANAIYTSGAGRRSFRGRVGRGLGWTAQAYDLLFVDTGSTDIDVDGLDFDVGGYTNKKLEIAGTISAGIVKVGRNPGLVTEAHGSATIPIGSNSVTVTHGLDLTPSINDITMTPRLGAWGGTSQQWWVSSVSSTQITFNTVSNVTSNDFRFLWQAKVLVNS